MAKSHGESQRQWQKRHPEYLKQWRLKHKEHLKEYRHKWFVEHREQEAQNFRDWRNKNKFRAILITKATVANQRYPGKVSTQDVADVLRRQGRICHWCGKKIRINQDLTLEHLKRVNDTKYLTIACRSCNASRRSISGPPTTPEQRYWADKWRKHDWYEAHKELQYERNKLWKKNHPEFYKKYYHEYYLRKKLET